MSVSGFFPGTGQTARAADIIFNGPVSTVKGSDAINPIPLQQGSGVTFNSLFYVLPGEGQEPEPTNPRLHLDPQQPFFIAYENSAQPVQSSDWWTGAGLQWFVDKTNSGWANSWSDGVIRSAGFISEPFYYQFVDFDGRSGMQPPLPPLHGLRLWNANAIAVRTDGVIPPPSSPTPTPTPAPFNAGKNIVDRGLLAPQVQAVVTVGLENVHPIGLTKPTGPPWTNVRVRKYTDWGAVFVYTDNGNQMEITMANGSPCTWLERTQGQANFLVWAGGPTEQGTRQPTVWQNENGVLGLTIDSPYNPDNGLPQTVSKAAYLVIADQGTWTQTDSDSREQSLFRNTTATKVVVLAMPHNLRLDSRILERAARDLKPFACRKIVNTQIDYPPIPGSQTSVNINGETVQLGYSPTDHRVASQLRVETQPFLPGNCPATDTCRLLFPHHVKSLHPGQRGNLNSRYIWHGVQGPLAFYEGSSFVQLVQTNGFLPFFPKQGVNTDLPNPLQPSQKAVDDIYETMRNWFYLEEFQTGGGHISSFVREIGTYDNVQFNTYEPAFSTLIESLIIADQLANSTKLTGNDTSTNNLNACLCKPKTQVAAEMRDYILQALKELVGHWADVYTSQFIQYNPTFNTTYGFPAGYFSVQNLSDHHFHFGYFLRAAAAISRYDRTWLDQYLPFIEQLRKDVANYDRNDVSYPFLRNFSPFYGHSWADGTGLDGNNQESLSEATNFSAGLIELGLLLGNNEWRDMGIYMYEQEILAGEQYWFNQGATLDDIVPPSPIDPNTVTYNGNWPNQFVTYRGPDGRAWHTTLIGIMNQRFLKRETFFAGVDSIYFIHTIPMSASTLYLGKNQDWLRATWQQFLLDTGAQENPHRTTTDEALIASLQARMPASGQGINGTGLTAALMRIARPHKFEQYATNTMAKYWAYTNSLLGQPDTSIFADIPAYGVFKDPSGNSSYVAYNSTNQSITATFKDRKTNRTVDTVPVPAQSMASKSSGQTFTFTPTQITPPASRLYLGPATGAPLPLIGQLSNTPGTFLPPNGTFPYPRFSSDISKIMPSLSIVPVSTGNCGDLMPPGVPPDCPNSNKAYAEWTGTFSGNLVGSRPFTQMTIYTDPALHTGWQQDPGIHATANVRIEYYFTPMSQTPDRIEVHIGVPESSGNTFTIGSHKITPYYFGRYNCVDKNPPNPNAKPCDDSTSGLYGLTTPPGLLVILDNRFAATAPFPASVTCGRIKVQVYGQTGANHAIKVPVPVSVGTSPLLNRASWIQPPYDGGSCP